MTVDIACLDLDFPGGGQKESRARDELKVRSILGGGPAGDKHLFRKEAANFIGIRVVQFLVNK